MAENILIAPFLNPVPFYDIDQAVIPQYLTKHFDDYLYSEQEKQYPAQQQTRYCQPWQTSDTIKFQYQSSISPITIELVDYRNKVYATIAMTNIKPNIYESGTYIFEGAISLAAIPEGCYFLRRTLGDPATVTSISGPLDIKVMHKDSKYIEYSNSSFHEDVIFETGIVFGVRNYGALWFSAPGSEIQAYLDQRLNPTILSFRPFRYFLFSVGDSNGIPVPVLDLYNRIFSCDTIMIDGKFFSAMDDFKITQTTEDGTLMQGVSMIIREGLNRASKITTTTSNPNRKLLVVYNTETKIFGTMNAGGSNNTTPIPSIE